VAPAWATARGAMAAQAMASEAARTRATTALATTDGAVARAMTGEEAAEVSTVWREGGAVAAPDS
jgi:hypothetical protein